LTETRFEILDKRIIGVCVEVRVGEQVEEGDEEAMERS
jgi:hypothetical protein